MTTFRSAGFWVNKGMVLSIILLSGIVFSSCEDLLPDLNTVISRDKLIDTWKVTETTNPVKSAMDDVYWVDISKHPFDSGKVVIYNFYNVDADAEATLDGLTLNLPLQTLEEGYNVSGYGEIQGNKANEIIWTYTADDGSGEVERGTAVYTRLTF